MDVTADEVEYQADRDIYVGRGHVVITQQGKTLTADHVLFSNKTRQGVATGNVVVKDGNDELRARSCSSTSTRSKAWCTTANSTRRAAATACRVARCARPDRTRTRSKAVASRPAAAPRRPTAIPGPCARRRPISTSTATGARATRRSKILGVPVLWVPYAVYPLKRERQTGFLFPQGGTSSQSGGNDQAAVLLGRARRPERDAGSRLPVRRAASSRRPSSTTCSASAVRAWSTAPTSTTTRSTRAHRRRPSTTIAGAPPGATSRSCPRARGWEPT